MANFYSKSNISLLAILLITTVGTISFTGLIKEKPLFLNASAQELSESVANSSNIYTFESNDTGNIHTEKNESQTVIASGHFANNQMKDGIVTWIQGGLWNLEIENSTNRNIGNPNMNATFSAKFTMIRPDGSLNHNHIINNLTSNNVIFAGNDIVVTGVSDIYADNGTEYEEVPITIHLMGKKVLGLMIDVNKTGGHFAGSNEMFGTLISGIGLDNSTSIVNSTINDHMKAEANNASNMNSIS